MPRAHFTKAVIRRVSGTPAEGSVGVFVNGSSTPYPAPLFVDDTSATTLANPLPFVNGVIEFYLDTADRVRLVITPSGATAQTFDNVDVLAPAGPARRGFARDFLLRG